jgi:hypothetical protein
LEQHHYNRELGLKDESAAHESSDMDPTSSENIHSAGIQSKETEFTEEKSPDSVDDITAINEENAKWSEKVDANESSLQDDEPAATEDELQKETTMDDEEPSDEAILQSEQRMPITVDFEGKQVAVGDYLKMQYVKHRVLPACLVSVQLGRFGHVEYTHINLSTLVCRL